jgi:hypothetical protein
MNVSRSVVLNALFNQVSSYVKENYSDYEYVPQFVSFGPAGYYRPFEKLPSDQQPVLYVVPGPQKPDQDATGFGITRWTLTFFVIVFFQREPDVNNPPTATVALNILDMLDDSLFNNGQPQTLAAQNNGVPLVANAWFDKHAGNVEIRLPVLANQAAIIAPVTVLTSTQLPGRMT